MALVENFVDRGPVLVGIGSEEDAPALWAADAKAVYTPADIPQISDFRAFRPEDTMLLVRPAILKVSEYRELHRIAEGEGQFQVIGHEPMVLDNDGAIADFRDLRAVVSRTAPVQETFGRKSKISYSLDQAEAILRKYYSNASPAEVQEYAEKVLGLEAGTYQFWRAKMLARKYVGNAKRKPPDGWDGILLDADGKPVHEGDGE